MRREPGALWDRLVPIARIEFRSASHLQKRKHFKRGLYSKTQGSDKQNIIKRYNHKVRVNISF